MILQKSNLLYTNSVETVFIVKSQFWKQKYNIYINQTFSCDSEAFVSKLQEGLNGSALRYCLMILESNECPTLWWETYKQSNDLCK